MQMKKVPLTWEDWACRESCPYRAEGTFKVKNSARSSRVTVSADGRGLVSQAGAVLLRETMRVAGLGRGLSQGLSLWRAPRAVHDPGKIATDLAAAVALGGDCLADIAVLREQPELAGPVASDPVASRLVSQLAGDLPRALKAIRATRAAGRERAWALAGDARPALCHASAPQQSQNVTNGLPLKFLELGRSGQPFRLTGPLQLHEQLPNPTDLARCRRGPRGRAGIPPASRPVP